MAKLCDDVFLLSLVKQSFTEEGGYIKSHCGINAKQFLLKLQKNNLPIEPYDVIFVIYHLAMRSGIPNQKGNILLNERRQSKAVNYTHHIFLMNKAAKEVIDFDYSDRLEVLESYLYGMFVVGDKQPKLSELIIKKFSAGEYLDLVSQYRDDTRGLAAKFRQGSLQIKPNSTLQKLLDEAYQ